MYSKYTDLLPSEVTNEDDLQPPNDEEVQDTVEKTRQALEKLTNSKIAAAMPVRAAPKQVGHCMRSILFLNSISTECFLSISDPC